jgi:hypothetical protein
MLASCLLILQTIGVLGFGTITFTTQTGRHLSTSTLQKKKAKCTHPHRAQSTALNLGGETGSINRRDVFSSILSVSAASSLLLPRGSSAMEQAPEKNKKPFAPSETLMPAVRVKRTIEKAINLTKSLIADSSTSGSSKDILNELENLLIQPQNYVRTLKLQGVPAKPADLYLDSYKPMKGDLPFQRYLTENGDVSTWKQLKKNEKEQERSSEVRAALNAYTDALSFSGNSYLLNVDKATRSSMVREDRLPGVKQVITSDMGMRYLYRNQVLTAVDDVKAELEYLLSHQDGRIDGSDLLDLLVLAEKALDRWLSLIDPNDVNDAIELVERD